MGKIFVLYVDKSSICKRRVYGYRVGNNDNAAFKNRIYQNGQLVF